MPGFQLMRTGRVLKPSGEPQGPSADAVSPPGDRRGLFFIVTPTPPERLLCRKIVSRSGFDVMASRYFGSAIAGCML